MIRAAIRAVVRLLADKAIRVVLKTRIGKESDGAKSLSRLGALTVEMWLS